VAIGLRGLPGSLLAHRTGSTYAPSFEGVLLGVVPGFLCFVPNEMASMSPKSPHPPNSPRGLVGGHEGVGPRPSTQRHPTSSSRCRRSSPCSRMPKAQRTGGARPHPVEKRPGRVARRSRPPRTTPRCPGPPAHAVGALGVGVVRGCYLVDPASSHMLVSKIKPCMCKYELIQTVKLRMAH
jgi:hypothetical protein